MLTFAEKADYIYEDINTQQQSSQKWQHLEDAGSDETGIECCNAEAVYVRVPELKSASLYRLYEMPQFVTVLLAGR